MSQTKWFWQIEEMFYEALDFYGLSGWTIEPIPNNVDTRRSALVNGEQRGWVFRTHNGRGSFYCPVCKKRWLSAYTTVVWRARWNTGTIQIKIEKQGCQSCEKMCRGRLDGIEHIGFALDWMMKWLLKVFYDVEIDETESSDDEPDDNNREHEGPHDSERCEARRKGTCRRCNQSNNSR